MKKILYLIFATLFVSSANAAGDALDLCLQKISANKATFESKINGIFGNADLNETIVEQNKNKIYALLSESFKNLCGDYLVQIAKTKKERARIDFKHKNKEYGFDFSMDRIFEDLGIQMGIVVINKRNLATNSILKLSDIPKKQKFFSDGCSDHTIWDNLDDDAAVNVAGQAVFSEYGGSEHEYFLDFAEGDNRRAFPGLVIQDVTGSSEEKIVSYINIKTAIERTQQFAEKLKSGKCFNQGLSVYLVALNVEKAPINTSDNRDTSAYVTSGVAGVGLTTGAIATGVGMAGGATLSAAALGTTATGVAWIPVAGWITAGVLGTAAATIALWPQTITDIQQVMILDGPYNL